jgi:hypothetical protein
VIERLNNELDAEQAEKVMLQEELKQERDKTKKLSKFLELSAMNSCYFKTLVIPTNTQFYNLCFLSITYPLCVSSLSPSSGRLYQNFH